MCYTNRHKKDFDIVVTLSTLHNVNYAELNKKNPNQLGLFIKIKINPN